MRVKIAMQVHTIVRKIVKPDARTTKIKRRWTVLTRIAQPLRGSADHKYHAQAIKIAQPSSPAVSDWTYDSTAHMPMAQKNRNPKSPRNFILPPSLSVESDYPVILRLPNERNTRPTASPHLIVLQASNLDRGRASCCMEFRLTELDWRIRPL